MRHFPIWYFAQAGIALDAVVKSCASDNSEATLESLKAAAGHLWWLGELREDFPLELYAARPQIGQLWRGTQEILNAPPDQQHELVAQRRGPLSASMRELITTLAADLGKEPVFLILQKRAYSTRTLIMDGPKVLGKETREALTTDEAYDIREATRCIAFEVPTAAAFHLFRAMEGVLKRYYALVMKDAIPKKPARTWDAYITNMNCYGDPKPSEQVTFLLNQVRWLYRNPISHPDEKASQEKAEALLGLADLVLTTLVVEIRSLSASTPADGPELNAEQPA